MGCAALQDMDCIFKICFPSEMRTAKQVIRQTMEFLKDTFTALSEEDLFDLKLIYSELLVNAVIHGNKQDVKKGVHLFVEVVDDMVYSVISDEGPGFHCKKVLAKIKSSDHLLEENGRGIRLVYSLADSLSFNRSGNQVTFYKQVGQK